MENLKKQFEDVYEEHADAIFRFCLYKTSDKKQAEDLTQECFIRFWNYMSAGKNVDTVKAFLYQIARNLVIDHYRKKKTASLDEMQLGGFEPESNGYEQIENESEKNLMIKVIDKLDEKYKIIVYLKLVEEMDIKEIAQSLDITTNNATVRLHRGLKQLHTFIETQ